MRLLFLFVFLLSSSFASGQDRSLATIKNEGQTQWLCEFVLIVVLFGIILNTIYFLQKHKVQKNQKALNYEIEKLTTHNRELLEKYKALLTSENEVTIETDDRDMLKKAIDIIEKNMGDLEFLKNLNKMK